MTPLKPHSHEFTDHFNERDPEARLERPIERARLVGEISHGQLRDIDPLLCSEMILTFMRRGESLGFRDLWVEMTALNINDKPALQIWGVKIEDEREFQERIRWLRRKQKEEYNRYKHLKRYYESDAGISEIENIRE